MAAVGLAGAGYEGGVIVAVFAKLAKVDQTRQG